MDDSDDISQQVFKLAWEQPMIRMFVIFYATFNVVILIMLTTILYKVMKK